MSLPKFTPSEFEVTQIPTPSWVPGSGANSDEWKEHKKLEIDPYGEGRPPFFNYKILTSAVVPRPIGYIATVDKDGKHNLAPYSYFSLANHDPPTFTVSIAELPTGLKDTAANILETKELTINIISEWFVEAAVHSEVNAPHGESEWEISGLTKAPSTKVKPPHVAEAAFSVEGVLVAHHPIIKKSDPSKTSGHLLIIEGVNFHAREDLLNEDKSNLDIEKYKPVSRLGETFYGRSNKIYDIPRVTYDKASADAAREVSRKNGN